MFGDLGKQAVLDGIPFGSPGGIMRDRSGDAKRVAQPSLDFGFPGPRATSVTTARIRQNQNLGSTAMAAQSLAFPPGSDGMGGEGRSIVRDADAYGAAVVGRVVNAVGDAHAAGIGAEVVIVHPFGRAIPFGAGVLEVANQFALLAVYADNGKALALEASPQRGNMAELLIPVGTGVGGDLLPVDAQREIHLVEKAGDGTRRNRDIDLLQKFCNRLRRFAGPLQPGDRISGGIVL